MTTKLSKYNQQTVEAIEWKTLQEPLVKEWTIRALPHDKAFIYKTFYAAVAGLTIFWGIGLAIFVFNYEDNRMKIISSVVVLCFYLPCLALAYQCALGGRLYSFRLTERHIEVVCWNDLYNKIKQGLSVFFIFVAIFLFIAFLLKPESILVTLGGAIGVGIMAGGTFYSDSFAQRETAYKHFTWQWKDFKAKRIIVDRDRCIVCLDAERSDDLTAKRRKWALFIFCQPTELEEIATIVSEKHPKLNVLEGASRIDNSFAL